MSSPPPSSSAAAYSLFPNPNAKPPATRRPPSRTRRSESRERSRTRAPTPGGGPAAGPHAITIDTATPALRQGRRTPQPKSRPSLDSTMSPQESQQQQQQQQQPIEVAQPPTATRHETPPTQVQRAVAPSEVPIRTDTAFSEAHTLVRSNSTRSLSSIAKLPIHDEPAGTSSQSPPLRSIFPQYNPDVALSRQEYFPTQLSPGHIPRAVISRTTWHPDDEPEDPPAAAPTSDVAGTQHHQHPQQFAPHAQPWPRRNLEMPPLPRESSNDQLKNLWKVLNGWRASQSDGRVYCMKLAQEKDMPVYTLSSRQQPFYSLRIDPTSASAYVALSRHDPSKPYKGPASSGSSSTSATSILSLSLPRDSSASTKPSSPSADAKNWSEVLTTTLEPETRRHRPEDGLIAVLQPAAAAKIAIDRPSDQQAIATAEAETARLVWDDDSSLHYLVHPAIVTPFCVTVERNPAWSRVEYTLEHHESPQHLAKLTRDGTGRGWLEVDTAVAARIDSFFVLDVAVAALLIVASGDDRHAQVETFEPPPLPPPVLDPRRGRRERSGSAPAAAEGKKQRGRSGRKMEEFDVDVESQVSSGFAEFKQATKETRRRLPWPLRFTFKVVGGVFKCLIWCLTAMCKAIAAVLIGIARCLGLTSKGG